MQNTESVLENGMHKFLRDLKIQTDHLISIRRPIIVIINKKNRTCLDVNLAVLAKHSEKFKKVKQKISTWTLLENEKKSNAT